MEPLHDYPMINPFQTCNFLNDATDAHILVAAMKIFGLSSWDDSPLNNKRSPPTGRKAVKKKWLFDVAESMVQGLIVHGVECHSSDDGKRNLQGTPYAAQFSKVISIN